MTKKKTSTAKGCPASTFLQRWAIFTGDFLGIDIEILLRKWKPSKMTSTSTTIDCMVIFVTFVDVVVPFCKAGQALAVFPRGLMFFLSLIIFAFWFLGRKNTVDGLNLWLCVCVLVYMFPCSCVSVIYQRSDVSYCGGLNHFNVLYEKQIKNDRREVTTPHLWVFVCVHLVFLSFGPCKRKICKVRALQEGNSLGVGFYLGNVCCRLPYVKAKCVR